MEETKIIPELPENLKGVLTKEEKYEKLSKDLENVQRYISTKV